MHQTVGQCVLPRRRRQRAERVLEGESGALATEQNAGRREQCAREPPALQLVGRPHACPLTPLSRAALRSIRGRRKLENTHEAAGAVLRHH